MSGLANIIWLLCGGLWSAIGYIIGGATLCATIIGIPFGLQCFKLASVVIWPFGRKIVSTNSSEGCLSLFFNLIWLVCAGFWIALIHIAFGILLCITVIGIPFGMQHFRLVSLSLMPFGKRII